MEIPPRLQQLFKEVPAEWHATALRALKVAEAYAGTGNSEGRQGTRLVVCKVDDFLPKGDDAQTGVDAASQITTSYGGVSKDNIRKFPKDIKTEEGRSDLCERMNDDGALIIDGPTGEFRASGFRLKYEGTAPSTGGGLGAAASQECAKNVPAFVVMVSKDGAIKVYAGKADPVVWKGDRKVTPPQIRKRYPPSLKPRRGQGGDDFFFGRKGPLEQLLGWVGSDREEGGGQGVSESFVQGEPFILISGIGGVGKSQLACEVLHRCELPLTKIWINAASPERLQRELEQLCEDFKEVGVAVSSSSQLRGWLERNRHWILVVDNLEDPELLWDFIPKNHNGTVVITSRDDSNPMTPPPKTMRLDTLQLPDAQILLQTLGKRPDDVSGSEKLAKVLGCLPLGLVMASSLVAQKRGMLSFSALAERVESEREEVVAFLESIGEVQEWTGYQHSIISLWRQQREFLCENGLKRAAVVMECLSFADRTEISHEICQMIFETCKAKDGNTGYGVQSGNFSSCVNALPAQSLCTRLSEEQKAENKRGGLGGSIVPTGFQREEFAVKQWYTIHELTQLAVRMEMRRKLGGGGGTASEEKERFNLMAWAMFVGRRTSRWEPEDLECRFPTPSGRHTHQLQLLKRWAHAVEKKEAWAEVEVGEVRALMLLCLWFERLFFQVHWSQRILRPWLLNEIEKHWSKSRSQSGSVLVAEIVRECLLEVVYDEKVHLGKAVAVLAHILRSFIWGDVEWQGTLFAHIARDRQDSVSLPYRSLIRMLSLKIPHLSIRPRIPLLLISARHHLQEGDGEGAARLLLLLTDDVSKRGVSELKGFIQEIKPSLQDALSLLQNTQDAAWHSAPRVSASRSYVVKQITKEPPNSDLISRRHLFASLVCKAGLERLLGYRARSAETLGMASALLPDRFSDGFRGQLSAVLPTLASGSGIRIESASAAADRFSPDTSPVDCEDLSAFFRARNAMWTEVGNKKPTQTPTARAMGRGCLEVAASIDQAVQQSRKVAEKRFEEDRRLARLFDFLDLMVVGEYAEAHARLVPVFLSTLTAEGENSPWDWKARFQLFVLLAYIQLIPQLSQQQLESGGISLPNPELALQTFSHKVSRGFPGRSNKLASLQRMFSEAPSLYRYELFEFLVWRAVDKFVSEVCGEGDGSLEGSCLEALELDLQEAVGGEDTLGWTGWERETARSVSFYPEFEKWRLLHPTNRGILYWLLPASVRLLQERGQVERVSEFERMGEICMVMESDSEPLEVHRESVEREESPPVAALERRKSVVWAEVKAALKERNKKRKGGEPPLLLELPRKFKELSFLEDKFHIEGARFISSVSQESLSRKSVFFSTIMTMNFRQMSHDDCMESKKLKDLSPDEPIHNRLFLRVVWNED